MVQDAKKYKSGDKKQINKIKKEKEEGWVSKEDFERIVQISDKYKSGDKKQLKEIKKEN
jgi:L1 cell adhesion molecule like protein